MHFFDASRRKDDAGQDSQGHHRNAPQDFEGQKAYILGETKKVPTDKPKPLNAAAIVTLVAVVLVSLGTVIHLVFFQGN